MSERIKRRVVRGFEVDAVLLDLDGVMVHSASSVERAWRAWADDWALAWEDVRPHVHGRLAVDTIKALLPHLDEEDLKREARKVNDRQVLDTSGVEPVAGMRDLVSMLPEGHWAVVTACPPELAAARLGAIGYPTPEVLVTCDDISCGKPDPEGYRLAAERLGTECSRCVVLEDSPSGIEAAVAAGTVAIGLRTTHETHEIASAAATVEDGRWLQIHPTAQGLSVMQLAAGACARYIDAAESTDA